MLARLLTTPSRSNSLNGPHCAPCKQPEHAHARHRTTDLEPPQRMWPLSSSMGDADKEIADAAVKVEGTYTMPDRHHNAMEPHATLAVWDGDGALTLYDSTQMVVGTRKLVSLVLGLPEEKI